MVKEQKWKNKLKVMIRYDTKLLNNKFQFESLMLHGFTIKIKTKSITGYSFQYKGCRDAFHLFSIILGL